MRPRTTNDANRILHAIRHQRVQLQVADHPAAKETHKRKIARLRELWLVHCGSADELMDELGGGASIRPKGVDLDREPPAGLDPIPAPQPVSEAAAAVEAVNTSELDQA